MSKKIIKVFFSFLLSFCVLMSTFSFAFAQENEQNQEQEIEDDVLKDEINVEDLSIEETLSEILSSQNQSIDNANNNINNNETNTYNDNEINSENTIEEKSYIMPNFVGKNYYDIEENIKNLGIDVVKIYDYSSEYPENIIMEQSINENENYSLDDTLEIVISNGSLEEQPDLLVESKSLKLTNAFGLGTNKNGTSNISIDGNFNDWNGLPISYEYNWDNSQSCWYWGEWYNGQCFKTPEGTYDNNVRHAMQLYCDGEYVYLHIKIATIYTSKFNGYDYQFWLDGQMATFQVEDFNGDILQENNMLSPGTKEVCVRHRDSSMSYDIANGSKAYLTIYDNMQNAELELKIPLSEMKRQNANIDLENIGTIEFFTPNLMYRRITCSGTSTGPIVFCAISLVAFGGIYFYYKSKKKKSKKD